MLKNGLILEKTCKNRRSVGGFTLNSPLASGGWGSAPDSELLFSNITATSRS